MEYYYYLTRSCVFVNIVISSMWIKRNISVQKFKKGTRVFQSTLLVESVREGKKVKHKTLLNLSSWLPEKVDAFDKFLKGKQLHSLEEVTTVSGKAIGAVSVFTQLAQEVGISQAIDAAWLPKILFLIIGRILTQGSRLHLLEWGQTEEIEEILGINPEKLTTDDLYATLDYLALHQEEIEQKLFTARCQEKGETPRIYLYDVTSSYLEGEQNELAAYGYNRDKKQGKKQIVIGLLTDEEGYPIAVRAFVGNTPDPKTVPMQIKKLAEKFGVTEVIFIGDKGMIKTSQIADLTEKQYHYITTITKPQIQSLITQGILQLSLFDDTLGEVVDTEKNLRYVYRKNPIRAQEMQVSREQKQKKIDSLITKTNTYLKEHPKAKAETAYTNLQKAQKNYHCDYLTLTQTGRTFALTIDQEALIQAQSFDGCFVMKTDCMDKDLTKQTIHDRYKDLKHVEAAFKTIKTGFLEIRPIFVRKESRTRGHIFVTMLAYLLIHEFQKRTKTIQATLAHKVDALDKVQTVELTLAEHRIKRIPQQPLFIHQLLTACSLTLPLYCST